MKSKKLISLLCAAALSASSFAGLAVTASAAATPVWSFDGSDTTGWSGSVAPTVKTDEGSTDNYLNFEAPVGKATNDTTFTLPTEAQLSDDYVLEYDTYIHGGNGMGRLNHYTQLAFTGANPVQDTQTYGGEYATAAQAINPDTAHSWSQDLNAGMGYTTDIVSSLTSRIELSCQGRWVINQKNVEPNFATDGTTVGDDKWVRVRAAVKDGKAAITIADSNQKYVDAQEFDADATKLSKIMLTFARADQVNFVPTTATTIKLDNIKVYDGIANAPAFSTDGLRATAVVATPIPAPEKVAGAAPKQYAPEAAITPYIANFNSAETGTITYVLKQEGGQDAKTVVNGMKVQVGTRKEGEDTMTYASIVEPAAGDKALRLNAGDMSTNGRGPVVSFDDDLSIEDMTGTSTILGFSTYISRTHLDGISRLFLLDNTDNVDGNSVARDVLAVITTEDIQNEDESYKYTAGEKNIGIHVEPDQWHKIAVAISENEYRVFVDGQYKDADGRLSPALKNDLVGTGEGNKNAVTHLPMFAIENTKTSSQNAETGLYEGGSAHATALIDNVVAYQIQGEVNDKLLPLSEGTEPTPAPTPVPKHSATITWDKTAKKATVTAADGETEAFDGVLVHAAYDNNKVLTSAKAYDVKNITTDGVEVEIPEADVVHTGDKLMLWNSLSGMVPYGVAVVEEGEAPIVKYAVKVAAAENGTVTVDKTTAEENEEVTITATPAENYEIDTITVKDKDNGDVAVTNNKFTMPAKDVTVTVTFKEKYVAPATYTITGTVDAGVMRVRLVDKADTNNAIEATIADGKATATGVKAGTYTINVGYNGGYEADTITPANGEIEVTADNAEAFTVTSKVSEKPAITGTVTIEGTPTVGQTLTANVTGLNDGETATYEWRAKAEGSEAFVAIADATASTLVLTAAMEGSQIKVVVKSAGTSGQLDSEPTAAVAGATYTVAGTVDAGVKSVTLTDKTNSEKTFTGTIAETAVTFANVPAGTYTVSAEANTGYKNVTIKKGEDAVTEVMVTDANVTDAFAVTTTPNAKSAVTIATVENGAVAVKNGETTLDATALAAVEEGTSLKVDATANAGYAVKTITVAPTNAESTTTVAVTNGKFTMPAEAVTVTVEFEYEGTFKITPTATYVNFQTANADTDYKDQIPLAGLVNLKNGAFAESSQAYTDTAVMTVVSIDASEYVNKIDDATLSFTGKVQASGKNTTVRYATYANYIDIANAEVKASNVNTLGGTAALVSEIGQANSTDTALSVNIKNVLKADADGKVTLVLFTTTGRATEITNLEVAVKAAETAYETATVNVHTVYEDENGAIEANGKKYTEFGTAKTATMYAGDKYTAGHTAVIDDGTKTARYDYVSGDDEITAAAGNNDIYLVYAKTDYQTVTFTAKIGDTATAGVPIKINGTPTLVGEAMTETTITTADGTAEGTTAGVVTIKLLPGAYNYAIDATATYLAVDATNFTVENAALPVEVVLTANQKASATLKVVYTTDGTAAGKVGEVTVYDAAANKFEDDVVSADDLASYRKVSKFANADGLYALYSYTSGGDQAVTLAGGENVVYITVAASEDTRLFNVYEDFEDGTGLFTAQNRIETTAEKDTTLNSNVQKFTSAGNAQNDYSFAHKAFPNTITKPIVTVSFDFKFGGRPYITIGAASRGTTGGSTKITYSSTGAIFNIGVDKNNAYVQGTNVGARSVLADQWLHANVVINTTTKKVSYTITKVADDAEVTKATDVAYVDTTSEITAVGQIDLFDYINNAVNYMDNLQVTMADAE